jgi:hypothetical protein
MLPLHPFSKGIDLKTYVLDLIAMLRATKSPVGCRKQQTTAASQE